MFGKSAINAVKAGKKLCVIIVIKVTKKDIKATREIPVAKARGNFFASVSAKGFNKSARSTERKIIIASDCINQNNDIVKTDKIIINIETLYGFKFIYTYLSKRKGSDFYAPIFLFIVLIFVLIFFSWVRGFYKIEAFLEHIYGLVIV